MPKVQNFAQVPNFPQLEEEVLKFWDEDNSFRKSVESRSEDKSYVFYDGPPFATGLPHYGHLLASTIKDVIPRYWTMKGYRVERVWGWDCHGLPIENMIEGELQLKGGKKGIEEFGIDKFNQACRSAILRFDKDWEIIIRRLGRWVNFKNSYKTMDKNYMESVWWGFAELFKKGLIYEGRKVVLYCPRCATPLSNFEIAMDNSYKDVEDNSVYVKFKVHGSQEKKAEYFLAWTTTPWTLPGNVALAVLPDAEYSQLEIGDELVWMAKEKVGEVAKMHEISHPTVVKTVLGSELSGMEYEPLFTYMPLDGKKAHYVTTADFVSLTDGTGIVHTAAIFGEDDYALAQRYSLPCVPTLDDEGKFLDFVEPVKGVFYKKAEQWIIDDLNSRGLVYKAEKYKHSYPFCYRCSTPLYYNAVPAWFIDVQKLKNKLIEANESINWFPEHLKHGRFGKGLETAPDWNISRSRYWGTPMPVWCATVDGKKVYRVVSSIEELKKWAVDPKQVEKLTDIHREFLDDVKVWVDDEKTLEGKRTPEVFDCWVESASMPFASMHYPFENKDLFEANYPAQFISEYIAQTRAWFYCMHVISVGLFDKPSFQNALTTGTILAEDGSKMSKSKKNYPDPMLVINKYGVDSLRLYLMSSVVMKADNLNFSEKEVDDLRKKVFVIWWNVFAFYNNFALKAKDPTKVPTKVDDVMDQWILSRLQTLIDQVTKSMDQYDVVRASRFLIEFVNELSTWYLRQSRERIKAEKESGKGSSGQVFGYVLYTLAQLFAPIAPFFSELIFHNLVDDKMSIHLTQWPEVQKEFMNAQLETEMENVQKVAEAAHAQRREHNVKVRQPLVKVTVWSNEKEPSKESTDVLLQEINVKAMDWKNGKDFKVELDLNVTPELKEEGEAREVMRTIQNLRKEAKVNVDEMVKVQLPSWPEKWSEQIKAKTKVSELTKGEEAKIL